MTKDYMTLADDLPAIPPHAGPEWHALRQQFLDDPRPGVSAGLDRALYHAWCAGMEAAEAVHMAIPMVLTGEEEGPSIWFGDRSDKRLVRGFSRDGAIKTDAVMPAADEGAPARWYAEITRIEAEIDADPLDSDAEYEPRWRRRDCLEERLFRAPCDSPLIAALKLRRLYRGMDPAPEGSAEEDAETAVLRQVMVWLEAA